jgi:chemotaxis protein histidine kinase CheA
MSEAFAESMAAVRRRFAAKLDARIDEIECAMPQPGQQGRLDVVVLAHRKAHSLCGIGPTLGFVGTGWAACSIEQLLLGAVNAKRALNDDEILRLVEGIALLRSSASAEMNPANQDAPPGPPA